MLLCIGYNIKKIAFIEKKRRVSGVIQARDNETMTQKQNDLGVDSINEFFIAQFRRFFSDARDRCGVLIKNFYLRKLKLLSPKFSGFC